MIGYIKKKKENNLRNAFEKRQKPGLKFNPQVSTNSALNNWAQEISFNMAEI